MYLSRHWDGFPGIGCAHVGMNFCVQCTEMYIEYTCTVYACTLYYYFVCIHNVGHEAVASEVGLGISTFKPSECPKQKSSSLCVSCVLQCHAHAPVHKCPLFIPMQHMCGHWS